MDKQLILLFTLCTTLSCNAFLFGGSGGGGCNACCPPSIPCNCVPQQSACQSYAPPPQQSQCPCAAKARDDKTVTARPLDELELVGSFNLITLYSCSLYRNIFILSKMI